MTDATGSAPLSRIPFSPRAEASILELSKWMRISAVISMVGAVLKLIVAFTVRNDLGQLIGSVVMFLIGMWSYQAAKSFAAVATTDTADQQNLMQGFGLLRRVFLMQAVFVILGVAVVVLAIVGGLIYLAAHGAPVHQSA